MRLEISEALGTMNTSS